MPKLTVRLPGLAPVTHALTGVVITVGRTPDNTVQVADPSVSKHHAKLEVINGDYHVVDLESRNGTFVNNQRIRDALVHHSDLIRFAGVEAIFETDALEDDDATVVTRPLSAAVIAASKAPTPRGPLPTAPAAPGWARPAGAAPIAATAATATALTPAPAPQPASRSAAGFSPKASAPVSKGMPTWMVLGIGIVLALSVAGGVWWWLNQSADSAVGITGSEPATAVVTAPPVPTPAPEAPPVTPETPPAEPVENPLTSRPISAVDVPAIGSMLRDAVPENRRQAARALHALGKDSMAAVKQIRDAVKDSDPETRLWASLSLAQLDPTDQASVPVLIDALKSENPVVRQVSALSLSVIRFQGDESTPVIELLIKLSVEDQDEDVRKAASSASKLLSSAATLR